MKSKSLRNINPFKVLLLFVLLVLIGIGVYVSINRDLSPTDSSASTNYCTCGRSEWKFMGSCNNGVQNVSCDGKKVCGNVVCGGYARIKCCNGTYVIAKSNENRDSICRYNGGYSNCKK